MDVSSVFNAFSQTAHLKPQVQRQLSAIYLTLLSTLGTCLGGYYVAYRFPFLEDYFIPLVLVFIAAAIAIFFMPPTPGNLSNRRALLLANGGIMGALIQPAILPLMYSRDADLVYMAVGLSAALFASFSVATMVSSKSQTVYAIGSASMALSTLLGLRLLGWFYPSMALFSINLVVGIAISCLYVVVHTHEVLELAQRGERVDPVTHAMLFFSDFVGLFFRLLRLLQNDRRREQSDEREPRHTRRRQFRPTESAFGTRKCEL
ncbi:Inhibitor of apoptosis-promoting Bax1-related protein [Coemansia sp. RSA 2050]|nr:Inhibitor of apoptosis-promoting Bax1-related protein [Coemansia sp. RSA 2050]KAJ2736762.1 Inhibitor of apoptosis-promoting Bax1-related protein [Coemansia sp. BCRC 34962]